MRLGPFFCALLVNATLAVEVRAQDDTCDPACVGDTLRFCATDTPTVLDCRALGGVCGELSQAWGPDCLLAEGAACDAGYAFGASRCNRALSLYCIDDVCTAANEPPPAAEPETPTPGTEVGSTSSTTNPFGCLNCNNGFSLPALLPVLWALRKRRRGGRS